MSAPGAVERAEKYLGSVDRALPGKLTGLYLVGSAALGDWHDKVSNVDAVAVADDPWEQGQLDVASRAHGALEAGVEPCRVLYATYSQLAAEPSAPGPVGYRGRRRDEAGELANPLTWEILAEEAYSLRGTEYFALHRSPEELRAWARGRLAGPWRSWVRSAGVGPARTWWRRPLSEALLEVTRLHVAASRAQAVSKVRSATLVLEDVPRRFERLLMDSSGFRQGRRTSMYWGPMERRRHALQLIDELTGRAEQQQGRPTRSRPAG